MPDILVRGVDADTLKRLKLRAKRNGRSLQSEAKMLLEQAAADRSAEIAAMFDEVRERFAGRKFSASSVDMIREDRQR